MSKIEKRRFPYPYRAMLAICSDLDETPDKDSYFTLMKFLNTRENTMFGPGVDLEIGNSIYFDMPWEQFSYWNTDDKGRALIRSLIRSGHIDCLHSFGDLAHTRDQASQALDELHRYDCALRVWVDHGIAPTNFGRDIMRGHGDESGHVAYHADLSCAYGIRYVWRGRVTSVIGQNRRLSLGGLWNVRHPGVAGRTVLKEGGKQLLARFGNRKYRLHKFNRAIYPVCLRDGHKVYEFLRSNPHWGGVDSCGTIHGISHILTPSLFDRLMAREGTFVLYTHLGKKWDARSPQAIGSDVAMSFRKLGEYYRYGRILVTTTKRLLEYCRLQQAANFFEQNIHGKTIINLSLTDNHLGEAGDFASSELQGLTFYVPEPDKTEIHLNGLAISNLAINESDHTGRRSVSIPWTRLEFPSL